MAAGFDPSAFWSLSLREYSHHMNGASKRFEHEHKARVWLAWHTAALTRIPPGKKLPDLSRMLGGRTPPRRQTPQQIETMGNILAAAWS